MNNEEMAGFRFQQGATRAVSALRSRFFKKATAVTFASFGMVAALSPSSVFADENALDVAEFFGTVVPVREAEITPIVSAWLDKITFEPGQMVEQGDVLLELYKPPAELRLQLAQAQLKAAQASLREAIADVKLAGTLQDRDVVSAVELEKAEAVRDVSAANVAQAEANVGLAELGVVQMTQKAPFAGVMSAPMVRENGWQDVTDGDITMAIITQLDPVQVAAEVPYTVYAARQQVFDSDVAMIYWLEFSLVLPDGEYYPQKGQLVSGGYTFDETSQNIRAWVEFPNPNHFLRPGLKVLLQSSVKSN